MTENEIIELQSQIVYWMVQYAIGTAFQPSTLSIFFGFSIFSIMFTENYLHRDLKKHFFGETVYLLVNYVSPSLAKISPKILMNLKLG